MTTYSIIKKQAIESIEDPELRALVIKATTEQPALRATPTSPGGSRFERVKAERNRTVAATREAFIRKGFTREQVDRATEFLLEKRTSVKRDIEGRQARLKPFQKKQRDIAKAEAEAKELTQKEFVEARTLERLRTGTTATFAPGAGFKEELLPQPTVKPPTAKEFREDIERRQREKVGITKVTGDLLVKAGIPTKISRDIPLTLVGVPHGLKVDKPTIGQVFQRARDRPSVETLLTTGEKLVGGVTKAAGEVFIGTTELLGGVGTSIVKRPVGKIPTGEFEETRALRFSFDPTIESIGQPTKGRISGEPIIVGETKRLVFTGEEVLLPQFPELIAGAFARAEQTGFVAREFAPPEKVKEVVGLGIEKLKEPETAKKAVIGTLLAIQKVFEEPKEVAKIAFGVGIAGTILTTQVVTATAEEARREPLGFAADVALITGGLKAAKIVGKAVVRPGESILRSVLKTPKPRVPVKVTKLVGTEIVSTKALREGEGVRATAVRLETEEAIVSRIKVPKPKEKVDIKFVSEKVTKVREEVIGGRPVFTFQVERGKGFAQLDLIELRETGKGFKVKKLIEPPALETRFADISLEPFALRTPKAPLITIGEAEVRPVTRRFMVGGKPVDVTIQAPTVQLGVGKKPAALETLVFEEVTPFKLVKKPEKTFFHAGEVPPEEVLRKGERLFAFTERRLAEGRVIREGKGKVFEFESTEFGVDIFPGAERAKVFARPVPREGGGFRVITSEAPEFIIKSVSKQPLTKDILQTGRIITEPGKPPKASGNS